MKLYATVASERASKGQGGNEYLDIDISVRMNGKDYILAALTARYTEDIANGGFALFDEHDEVIAWLADETKGKRQKGICDNCGNPECARKNGIGFCQDTPL